ncbi:MAG: GerMN domain-containing protein, partial [Gemmatimonadota bacterium]
FAVRELLAGPEGSAADSVHSWFSDSTAGMLRDVVVVDGSVVVDFHDFRPIIPNAASSAGALMLLDQLRATVFQFPEAERIEFRIEGDCAALMEWLQMECTVFRRSGYEPPRGFREVVTRP